MIDRLFFLAVFSFGMATTAHAADAKVSAVVPASGIANFASVPIDCDGCTAACSGYPPYSDQRLKCLEKCYEPGGPCANDFGGGGGGATGGSGSGGTTLNNPYT